MKGLAYLEKGKASSRANAYAILVSANMAEQPVKNWTSITQNHMAVAPFRPPALRKICAAGRPVGEDMIPSKSVIQKQKVTVSIQPMTPETTTASLMATGPRIAASWVSSDILWTCLARGWQMGTGDTSYCCEKLEG